MNIEYSIDPVTGLMRLSFKQDILDKLPLHQQHNFKNEILDLLDFNGKLILTGGIVLKLLGFEEMSAVGDFDFLLSQTLTEGEYQAILHVFDLIPPQVSEEKSTRDFKFSLSDKKWSLSKIYSILPTGNTRYQFKIDILNNAPTIGSNSLRVYWGDREVRMTHPAQVWGTRVILGLNTCHWPKTKYNHWQKILQLFRDEDYLQEILEKLQEIEAMEVRVISYNSLVEYNQAALSKALNYINTHDVTSPDFYDGLFSLILDPVTISPLPPVL